ALHAEGFTNITPGGTTMTEIVEAARGSAESGDIVLLSTGCASFGLFSNYKDRGNQFKQVVTNLR
ncbi:MAG TPA: UDP-N-acetylmuramoyl-L-alanine--D-glutamate ligase, partial [Candidatus Saccharimonadia bacterium]|nr:UDP-N-acetylmuramoyl-L-alanine--D-glutamate ligase [Candidatus Saccharimonadia bacterium]